MTNFTLYKFDKEVNIVELGQGDDEQISQLLEDCLTNAKQKYDYGEELTSKTSFGIVKIDSEFKCNFLEIYVINDDHVNVYSDRLVYSNIWSKIFSTKSHIGIKSDKVNVKAVIDDYLKLDRLDFENSYSNKYQNFYCR